MYNTLRVTSCLAVLWVSLVPAAASAPATGTAARRVPVETADRVTVDPDGLLVRRTPPGEVRETASHEPGSGAALLRVNPTIDAMSLSTGFHTHPPAGGLVGLGFASSYALSDGTTWQTDASHYLATCVFEHVEVIGTTLHYYLLPPADGMIFYQTEYTNGDRTASGALGTAEPMILEATVGSNVARLSGAATVLFNDPPSSGDPRFHYYRAIPDAVVRFDLTYTIYGATWQADTFDRSFFYSAEGTVDLAHPISSPAVSLLEIRGSAQVPPEATVPYAAIVHYENGIERNVTDQVAWEAAPAPSVSIAGGLLTTLAFDVDRQPVSLRARYTGSGAEVLREKTVLGLRSATIPQVDSWPMYQWGERHRGYIPRTYEPETFHLRWQKALRPGGTLNPVAAADGGVYVSATTGSGTVLFAIDAFSGDLRWAQDLFYAYIINPPSWAYGNVYLQTVNGDGDNWLRAFDATTGEPIFRAPFSAQWDRAFAPTIYDGTAYVNGGYFGGMYAFNAFSGERRWWTSLDQVDQWTPAIVGDLAYAYVGPSYAGLHAHNRTSGEEVFQISDPEYAHVSWSMNLAPVVLEDGDALVVNGGRLIRFDVQGQGVAWQNMSYFMGQPTVAGDVIYATTSYEVKALDVATGQELWSWGPVPNLLSPVVATDSHLFVSTSSRVYALDLQSHETIWSYPAGGPIALADDNLYIAKGDGTLVAIAAVPYSDMPPVSMEIRGPDHATEFTSVPFQALVLYPDGRVRDRTGQTSWSIVPSAAGSITDGVLSVGELLDLSQDVTVRGQYSEGGGNVETGHVVSLEVSVSPGEFVERNRLAASALHEDVLHKLAEAMARENSILRVPVGQTPPSEIQRALALDGAATKRVEEALKALTAAGSGGGAQPVGAAEEMRESETPTALREQGGD